MRANLPTLGAFSVALSLGLAPILFVCMRDFPFAEGILWVIACVVFCTAGPTMGFLVIPVSFSAATFFGVTAWVCLLFMAAPNVKANVVTKLLAVIGALTWVFFGWVFYIDVIV